MRKPDAHYTVSLVNHQTGQQFSLELVDLKFAARGYRLGHHDQGQCTFLDHK